NIEENYAAGIRPITVATTILKPGGYERIKQLAEKLEPLTTREWLGINTQSLAALAADVPNKAFYRKEMRPVASRKTKMSLGLYDCFQAPCKNGGCPIEQQIPEYLKLVAEEKYDEAFRVIAIDNANPSITGTICDHACQGKCTRLDYDESLQIRTAKLLAANAAQTAFTAAMQQAPLKTGKKAVVIGAGPAGISAALFLRRNGVAVTVLEKREKPFGIVQYIIPEFRIPQSAIQRDFEMAEKAGVEFRFGVTAPVNVAALQKEYDFVLLAIGAWKEGAAAVEEGQEHLRDALEFLEESKRQNCHIPLGRRVAIIGGGDVAMDCARAAKRAPGVEEVRIVYRRTRDFMPAEPEEILLAAEDGVEFTELHAPKSYDGKTLCCEEMQLGEWDESGRRGILGTGRQASLAFDTVICAVGARVDGTLFKENGLSLDGRGRPVVTAARESSLPGVYVIGDCKTGPATVVAAIADAKFAAIDILHKLALPSDFVRVSQPQDIVSLYNRKGLLAPALKKNPADGFRCLTCDQLCELCCDVCPNRANVEVAIPGFKDVHQILHVDGLCNECGNCGIFCPHKGNPYKDKVTVFWTEEDFEDSANRGFLKLENNQYRLRLEDGSTLTCALSDSRVPAQLATFIQTVVENYSYYLA
ncbi:MAG: FAD-dependent oxidoreductase, partial [Oscillospiraceae bacterium]